MRAQTELTVKRYPWLDTFRATAALAVVLVHARAATFVEYGALPGDQKSIPLATAFAATRLGSEAVIAFFVLSGFLVGGPAVERMLSGTFHPVAFAIARGTRILTPLLPALALTIAVGVLVGEEVTAVDAVANLMAFQGVLVPPPAMNAPLWSLSYEVWFYVLTWATGLVASDRRRLIASAFALLLIGAIFTKLTVTYLFCWLSGAFAYLTRPSAPCACRAWMALAACGAFAAIMQLTADSVSLPVERYRAFFPPRAVTELLFASAVAALIQELATRRPTGVWQRVDFTGTWIAGFSYTLYLTHYPVLRALNHWGMARAQRIDAAGLLRFALATATCLAVAGALFFAFEKRTPRLRSALLRRFAAVSG